jgi:hypothetical protein
MQERGGGARFEPGGHLLAGQGAFGHQAVDVRVGRGEGTVGRDEGGQRFRGVPGGGFERGRGLFDSVDDDGGFQGRLVRQVLVQGRGPNADRVGDAAYGQGVRALGLQQFPGDGDDLPGALAQRRLTTLARQPRDETSTVGYTTLAILPPTTVARGCSAA